MQTERQLNQMIDLWSAANDAKADRITELESVVVGWRAAGDAQSAQIAELTAENTALRQEIERLRSELSRVRPSARAEGRRPRLMVVR
jgi:cell division protein FtsB